MTATHRIETTTIVRASPDQLAAKVGDEIVMMGIEHGRYYGLNELGAEIWRRIAEPKSVDVLCQELETIYDVTPEICRGEVIDFLGSLDQNGLIEVVDAAVA
jgi:hypothetical protein